LPNPDQLPHKAKGGWLVHVWTPQVNERGESIVEEYQVGIQDQEMAEKAVVQQLRLTDRGLVKAVEYLGSAVLTGHSVADGQIAQWHK
jgi:hypothetical protein